MDKAIPDTRPPGSPYSLMTTHHDPIDLQEAPLQPDLVRPDTPHSRNAFIGDPSPFSGGGKASFTPDPFFVPEALSTQQLAPLAPKSHLSQTEADALFW